MSTSVSTHKTANRKPIRGVASKLIIHGHNGDQCVTIEHDMPDLAETSTLAQVGDAVARFVARQNVVEAEGVWLELALLVPVDDCLPDAAIAGEEVDSDGPQED